MRESLLHPFLQLIDYRFSNPALLELALTHRSSEGKPHNERLEFLGDSILNCVIAGALYNQLPTCTEGELSRLRASLVKGETLSKMAAEMGLGDVMHFGVGERHSGGHRRGSTLEDALEALIGAIYLDSDFQTIQTLILKWFHRHLSALDPTAIPCDYKSRLQEWLQAQGHALPAYSILSETGPDHAKKYQIQCAVPALKLSTVAEAHSKKAAEQRAAERMLSLLQP